MSISIHPALETRLRERAAAAGLSVDTYVERLLRSEEQAEEGLERQALEGLNSGAPIEVRWEYWEEKHRRLDERLNLDPRLKKTGSE